LKQCFHEETLKLQGMLARESEQMAMMPWYSDWAWWGRLAHAVAGADPRTSGGGAAWSGSSTGNFFFIGMLAGCF